MMFPRLAAGLLLAWPALAVAQPASPPSPAEQAASVQEGLRQWIAALVGPRLDVAAHQPRVIADSDALRVELPLAGPLGPTGWTVEASPAVARIKPLADGRWEISSFAWPTPIQAEGPLPAPRDARGDKPEGRKAPDQEPPPPVMGQWLVRLGGQKLTGELDPTLRTASSFDAEITDEAVHFSGRDSEQTTRIGHLAAHYGWEPASDGRARLFWKAGRGDYRLAVTSPRTPPVTLSIAQLDDEASLEGVSFAQLGAVVRGIAEGAAAVSAGGNDLDADQRAALRRAVAALPDLLDRFHESGTARSITFDAAGIQATLASLDFENAGEGSGEGLARVSTRFVAQGFDSPAIPPAWRELVPHKLVLASWAGGLPGRDLADLALHALDQDAPPPDEKDLNAMMARGPITLGLDELSFDLGPAAVAAQGEMRVPAPREAAGTLHIRATGLDALMALAQKTPALQQMIPALAMLKGFARPQGEALVWDVVYAKGHTTVNGTDLTALLGGGKEPGGLTPPHRSMTRP